MGNLNNTDKISDNTQKKLRTSDVLRSFYDYHWKSSAVVKKFYDYHWQNPIKIA